MTTPFPRPPPELVAEIRAAADAPLSPEEFAARLAVPIGEREREEALSLIDWFTRRYPTPAERLAYARRAYARWTATARSR